MNLSEENRINDDLLEEIFGKDNDINNEEEIKIRIIKEQALILSEEINECCNSFRNRLKNGQILGYQDILAKFYYDIAYANYKYYNNNLIRNNLFSVKKYFEKSLEQFNSSSEKINIIKETIYILDSICDLYLKKNIDENNLPLIPGNAIIIVRINNSNNYICYFVENNCWIRDKNNLKSIQLKKVDFNNIKFNDKSGLVIKNETNRKYIENIIRNAQLKRGHASINIKYYALKRKRKQLEKDLERKILYAIQTENVTEVSNEENSTSTFFNFLNRVKDNVKNVIQFTSNRLGYEVFGIYDLLSVINKLLTEIIECCLEIGLIDESDYYINLYDYIFTSDSNCQYKLNEYKLRKELIIKLREIIDCETALLSSQTDDIHSFIVKKPENNFDYNTEIEKWKRIQGIPNNRSILFIYNCEKLENHWESWFWIGDKIGEFFKFDLYEKSLLTTFLKHIYYNKTVNLFSIELIDMLTDEKNIVNMNKNFEFKNIFFNNNNKFNLKSKTTKIIEYCFTLKEAYHFIGHYPLENRYQQIISYFSKEKNKFLKEFSSSYDINYYSSNFSDKKHKNEFILNLFPISTGSSIKKLNDKITEKEFFFHILPNIDQIENLKRSFTSIYEIDWHYCDNQKNRDQFLNNWQKDNRKFHEINPYQKKCVLLLIECDFYFISNFNENNLPKIKGNAIILTNNNSNNVEYKCYFLKDNFWIRDERINNFKTVIIKNINLENIRIDKKTGLIDKSKSEIEKLSTEINLNRWYFYGETFHGRILQGFIDQINDLKHLNIDLKDILLEDFKKQNKKKFQNKEKQIINYLTDKLKNDNNYSKDNFIKPISDKQKKEFEIYDLRNTDDEKNLKNQIKSDRKKNFICIAKLSNEHYITLCVESERSYKKNNSLRYIYIINSTHEKHRLKKLKWLTGVIDQCIYKIDIIECPKQKLMSQDSLLHAYFNASASKWALENSHWNFLKNFFLNQEFSNKKNIEKIKQWFIETKDNIPITNYIEDQILQNKNIELIEKFQKYFKEILSLYLNSFQNESIKKLIESLTEQLIRIETFNQIFDFIQNLNQDKNINEIKQCLDEIEKIQKNSDKKQKQSLDVNIIVDSMFLILKQYSNHLCFQDKIRRHLQIFENELHHLILSNIKIDKYPDYTIQLKMFFDLSCSESSNNFQISDYFNFIEFFQTFINNEKNLFNRELCKNIKEVLENGIKIDSEATNKMSQESLKIILEHIQKFSNIEISLKHFDEIFKNLLSFSYELIDLTEINIRLKNDIYNYISNPKQEFQDIKDCIDHLFKNIKTHQAIKIDFNIEHAKKKLKDEIFPSLNDCIKNNDQRAVHYIGSYLRENIMNRIDHYINSLVLFREKSLNSMENFHKNLHEILVDSIRKKTNKQIANEILNSINLENLDYDKRIDIYKKMIELFSRKKNLIPLENLNSLKTQIENISHSHFVYLEIKIDDLIKMLNRFSKIEKDLNKFSELFEKCLSEKYDHLSEEEVFSSNGQIKIDILNNLTQNKNFNDIKKIFQIFHNNDLKNFLINCEQFSKENDEKASTEISAYLRECIIDTIENFTSNLLTYRHSALIAFNHFETNFYNLLSTYEAIQNKNLRDFIRQRLSELINLPNELDKNYYSRSLDSYKRLVENLDEKYQVYTLTIKDTLNEKKYSLKPYLKDKINNLKNILNGYINWYEIDNLKEDDYEIFQIKTNSAILSEIINVIKSKYPSRFSMNNEIRIINSNKLYIDIDLAGREYSGVNIVLISPHQQLVNNKYKLIINTDGQNAKDVWIHNPARNGNGTDQNGRGFKGEDGSDGKSGKSAGHIYVVANELPEIQASACGGKGGSGQDGGNGAPGLDGTDGKDADKDAMIQKVEGGWAFLGGSVACRYRSIGTDGMPGGWGGDAGSGGFRGLGGNPGIIKIVALNRDNQKISYKNSKGDDGNNDGKSGKPGEAGKHGRDGLDYVILSHWINPFKALVTTRQIDMIKGGRLFPNDRYNLQERREFEDYSMVQMQENEESFRFRSKYIDRNSQREANMAPTHKNQDTVQKIHAIDHQHVFQQTSQFFNQFSNPQQLSSYQHWLAPNLNKFLEKMSTLEGLPAFEVNSLPDVEHDAKKILILKEKFSQTISMENQKLNKERINTDQLSIGIILLEQNILSQYNDFLQQYQIIYQQLQDQIQQVDVNQLTTGLQIRNVEIANLTNSINRIINEQRFNQRLSTLERRANVLVDMPKEKLSKPLLDKQNVKILEENFFKQQWKIFQKENNIVNSNIIENFNKNPNEENLLKIGFDFLLELENQINQSDLNKNISNFISIYLYNLQQGNYNLLGLEYIEKQKRILYELLLQFKSLENTSTLDLLIEFFQGIQREYLRQYWLIWITKTLEYSKNNHQSEENFQNILEILRVANDQQIEQLDNKLESNLFLLKEFLYYDFDKDLYRNNRLELLNSITKFNEECNSTNLIEIFRIFSNSSFFNSNQTNNYQKLLLNIDQLDLINDFLFTFQNNLNIINIDDKNLDNLTEYLIKIEEIFIQNPHSYFHNIIFNFSILIEKFKINKYQTLDKSQRLDEIYHSKDFYQLLNYQISKSYEKKKYTIEQQIDAFNTLYDHHLVESIFFNLLKCSNFTNDEKLIEFIRWTTDHFQDFEYKTIENILDYIERILKNIKTNKISTYLKFLKIIFNYKKLKFDIENEERVFELIKDEKENILKEILSNINQSNDLFEEAEKDFEKAFKFYTKLFQLINILQPDNFQSISHEKLSQLKIVSHRLLNNLSKKNIMKEIFEILKNSQKEMPSDFSEIKIFINEFDQNREKTINYLKKILMKIDDQQKLNENFNDKKILLNILDKIFSDIENLDDDIRIIITNKLYPLKIDEFLLEKENFCFFIYKIKEKIEEKINFYLKQNNPINELFEKQIEKIFSNNIKQKNIEKILLDLVYPFIDILNLFKYSYNQNIHDDVFIKTIQNLEKIQDKNVLLKLREEVLHNIINSYPIYTNQLAFIKKYVDKLNIDEKVKNFEVILIFLYEQIKEKSEIITEIYNNFYKCCQKFDPKLISIKSLIKLMKLITRAHEDGLYPDKINIDHAQFQLIILHILFKENSLLKLLNDQFIDFLFWLFETLLNYDSSNIEINNIGQLKIFSIEIDQLPKNNDEYIAYLNKSLQTIYQQIELIYIKNYLNLQLKDNSNAKWLEIIVYFPENFLDDTDEIIDLIKNKDENHINNIQAIIFNRISILQKEKLNKFYQLINIDNLDLKTKIEKCFEQINGYLLDKIESCSIDKIIPYYVLNFNNLLDTLNEKLETDGVLFIEINTFIKILQCLSCFEDIRLSNEKLLSSSQIDWLKILLIEHIIEKFSLIFPEEKQIEFLRNMLMRINEKILFLFNNVFITQFIDQINQAIYSINENKISNYQKITKDKFILIVELLENIPATKQILDQLSDASLTVWDTILQEIEFSKIFSLEMEKFNINLSKDNLEEILLFLNRIRIQLGYENKQKFLNFFNHILEKIGKSENKNIEPLNKLLKSICYQKISFEQANDIILKFDYQTWIEKIENLSKFENNQRVDRSAQEILNEIIDQQKNKINVISEDILKKIVEQVEIFREKAKNRKILEGHEKSEINREIQEIFNEKSYQNNPEEYVRSNLDKIVPLILYAWSIANKPQFPKDAQIVALLLFIHSQEKGLLEQVRTGEGKTLIAGITAAFFALCGNAVDIVSSNRDLAIEGEKKCRSFFQLLKIESGHICSEDDDVNHQSYRPELNTRHGNIVYGEVGAFQRDILEQEFNNKKIFGKRYQDRNKCLIVDEVDNMCLDRARHVLYLSHEIQSLKWIETLFIFIWTAVLRTNIENENDLSENIKDISTFIKRNIENKNIFIPNYMNNFVHYKIERWVDSAFKARFMREDDHFVLDISKTDDQNRQKQKTIIVLDKDTGVEQYSTRWSHGLAQFLELKYRRKISIESLKAVFISNKAFFQRYKNRLYGLTGTLGSENSLSFLSEIYQVIFVDLPTSKKKYFYHLQSKIAIEYSDWLDLIAKETIKQAEKRPVLIICENVEATENIWNELIRHNVSPHTIEKYRRDGDNVEERFSKKPATAGDIIIATNKGGRGTDIHVDEQVNKEGGMHVILTYLPENIRVEEQAFGRTARNGAQGTGQYILQIDKSINQDMYEIDQIPLNQQKDKLENLSDIIIERQKINRDNKEAARLSELKQKNILHLEVEEELFEKFNQFKNEISRSVFEPLFENQSEKSKQIFVDAFENVLKNRWAFWLDGAKEKIDKIETSQQKLLLLNDFDLNFVKKLREILLKSSFNNLLENFINQPEEANQIGKVCLSEKNFLKAKFCFETAIKHGDITGFSYIGLVFSIIHMEQNENTKKLCRKELKKAIDCLESIKHNLMSNIKIAEFLPQLATDEILKKVSSKENFYQDQITGKLEVIGLHLHYLKQAVGDTLEPFDCILNPENEKNITEEEKTKGKELFDLLVKHEIIQGDKIRKRYRKNSKEREKMEKMIRDDIDPSIAESLIPLLNSKNNFERNDFENIVCYNDELWNILNIKNFENVFILDIDRLKKELPERYENIWKDLEEKIDSENVNILLFQNSIEKKKLKEFLEKEQILTQTKRVKITDLDFNCLQLNKKYSKIIFNDNGHETKDLKTYLIELKDLISKNREHFYQTDLPFSTKEQEANKIRIYLKHKNILKSGGLNKFKYEDIKEKIETELNEILKDTLFENDKELILSKILSLQGDIRSYKENLKVSLKDFLELKDQENVPTELKFFEGIGLNKFLILTEDKSWWDWNAFAVAMIGLAQVVGGAILISFGLVNIGGALISEGINDMIYATMAGLSGNFSWKDWAIQKTISLSLSIATLGIGKLASTGNTLAKVGSVSKAAIFAKTVGKAASQFALTCLTNVITEKVMEQIQQELIKKVVNTIEQTFLTGLINSINNKVRSIYATSKNEQEFEKLFKEMKKNLEVTLGRDILLPQQFDNIRLQVVSSLKNSHQIFSDALKKSNSKYAKIAANAINVTIMIDQLWNLIEPILQIKHVYQTFKNIIEGSTQINQNNDNNTTNINENLVKIRAEQLNNIIRQYISNELTRKLDTVLRQIISGTLKQIGKAIGQGVKAMIDSEFNGKNPIDTLKQSNQNKENYQKSEYTIEQPSLNQDSNKEQENQAKREDLQNNIKNPKEMIDDNLKNQNRPLDRADIKMLADSKMRNIIVYNEDTGEKEIIKPSGLRQIPAFFKQSAEICYQKGENGGIGHYYTARGIETYTQLNGKNNCLLIAYHDSLGTKVNEEFIEGERKKFDQYTNRHLDRLRSYRQNMYTNGQDQMIGGTKQKKENEPKQKPEFIPPKEIDVIDPEFTEEKTTKERKMAPLNNKQRQETQELWEETIKKSGGKEGEISVTWKDTSFLKRYETDNLRLDDQGATGTGYVVNLQAQLGGKKYQHQRKNGESTTFANLLVTKPNNPGEVYNYKITNIIEGLQKSLDEGKIIRISPRNSSQQKTSDNKSFSTSNKSNSFSNQKKK